jgi:hypothetical protein
MRTLYALALICLSVPAFAGDFDVSDPYEFPEETTYELAGDFATESTASIAVPATPKSEDVWAEFWMGADSETADQPDPVALAIDWY